MRRHVAISILIGAIASIAIYSVVMMFAFSMGNQTEGPIPRWLTGIPIPLVFGSAVAVIVYLARDEK